MATLLAEGAADRSIDDGELRQYLSNALAGMGSGFKRVLLIPPDISRFYSGASAITNCLYDLLGDAEIDIMPALGTHNPMSAQQIHHMFGDRIPLDRYLVHDWRNSLRYLGDVPSDKVDEWSEGKVDYSIRIEVNEKLFDSYDLILSIGQIVPHEVVGMANYTKNICVGVGGQDTINKSHFLGAVYGAERLMGRVESPPRKVFNYGYHTYLKDLPIQYILTVMEKDENSDRMHMRGLYIGDDDATFEAGCKLSQQVNIIFVDKPQKKVVAYMLPHEFKSTWIGNKAVYRSRMMIADGGELLILAPGLVECGEDKEIDRLIRKYGYFGTDDTLQKVKDNEDLAGNLSAAAHLIHGTSDGRFKITYCPGPGLDRSVLESVGYETDDLDTMLARYNPSTMKEGYNVMPDGEELYFLGNPGLGLWSTRDHFEK